MPELMIYGFAWTNWTGVTAIADSMDIIMPTFVILVN
jgi:hypothetical protein